jgi:aminopeptidase N
MRRSHPAVAVPVAALVAAALTSVAGCSRHYSYTPAGPPSPPPVSTAGDDAGRSTPVADPVYPSYGNPGLDVLHYHLGLRWSPTQRLLTGTATLTVRGAAALSDIRLDLGTPLAVDGVTVDGAKATATHPGAKLVIAHPLAADQRATLVISYHGTPAAVKAPVTRGDFADVGFQINPDGSAFSMQEPFGAFTWYPSSDQPSDKALYDVNITVPDGWTGVTNGQLTGPTESGGEKTYQWHSDAPIATYLVAFAVDHFDEHKATGPRGIPITTWYRSGDAARLGALYAKIPQMLTWLEGKYGPYPFASAGVMGIPGTQSGMETQTMISVAVGIPEDALLHEFSHQWFGDAVTPTDWTGIWLNEGFAMYTQAMYDAEVLGGSLDRIMSRWRAQDQGLRLTDGPPGHYKPTHFASSNVYYCPALMLHSIRQQIGDAKFFPMMRDWVGQHRYTNQDRASFLAYLNQYTGHDFTALVNAWLDSPTTPPA